jgi:branched-chain amino acid transport system permease protein
MTYGLILVFEELRSLLVGDDVHGVPAAGLAGRHDPLGELMTYPVYRLFISACACCWRWACTWCSRARGWA